MFTFALILACASAAFELMIAAKIPIWRRLSGQSLLFNLGNSMVLSYLVGIMFGAAGLIAMTAGIFSTIMTIPGYKVLYWCYDSPQAQAHGGNMLAHYSQHWFAIKAKWGQTLRDLFTVIYKIIRVITFPIWFSRACVAKLQSFKSRHPKLMRS